ncbi:MAG: hypothetical protein ACT4OZ_03795 [Gemmatimonadota bacterium]
MNRFQLTLALVAGALLTASATIAQVPQVTLRPLAEHPEALTEPGSMRELRDGRLIVSDVSGMTVLLLDFKTEEATPAAREGAGPLEFRLPGPLFHLGDSILMQDAMLRRFLVFGPDGKPKRTFPMAVAEGDMLAFVRIGRIVGMDTQGRFYSESRAMTIVPGKMPVMSDTVALVRWSKLGEKGDTLATRLERIETPAMSGDPTKGIKLSIRMDALTPKDMWEVFPDGRVLLVRLADYRPEVIDRAGQRTQGARVAYSPVPLTLADRQKLIKETRAAYERGIKMGMSMAASMAGAQKMPKIDFDILEPAEWPKNRPPFFGSMVPGASAASDGTFWVPRTMPGLSDVADYDVLDASGKLISRVKMPPRVTVFGFGKGVVYGLRKDEDDLHYVQRYTLP